MHTAQCHVIAIVLHAALDAYNGHGCNLDPFAKRFSTVVYDY